MQIHGATNEAFWTVIAQIVPVFALALVLESRSIARRWSKRKYFRSRSIRVVWFLVMIVAWIVVASLMSVSLSLILRGESSRMTTGFATAGVTYLAAVTVGFPLSGIISGFVTDIAAEWWSSLPWSNRRRMLREERRLLQEIRPLRLQIHSSRVDLLVLRAQSTLIVARALKRLDVHTPEPDDLDNVEMTQTIFERINVALEVSTASLKQLDADEATLHKYVDKHSTSKPTEVEMAHIRRRMREMAK